MTNHNDEQPRFTLGEVVAFLTGESQMDGVWFGDKHPTERGNYWWRKHLRAAVESRTPSNEPQPAARQAPARSATVDAGIQAMNSAFIDVTLHAQTAFQIAAYIKELERTLSSRSMQVVPKGWILIPEEPGEGILKAFHNAEMARVSIDAYYSEAYQHKWKAMINYAKKWVHPPTPPASNAEEVK